MLSIVNLSWLENQLSVIETSQVRLPFFVMKVQLQIRDSAVTGRDNIKCGRFIGEKYLAKRWLKQYYIQQSLHYKGVGSCWSLLYINIYLLFKSDHSIITFQSVREAFNKKKSKSLDIVPTGGRGVWPDGLYVPTPLIGFFLNCLILSRPSESHIVWYG